MAPWLFRYIHTGHIHIRTETTERTNGWTGTRETRERYIILLLLPLPCCLDLSISCCRSTPALRPAPVTNFSSLFLSLSFHFCTFADAAHCKLRRRKRRRVRKKKGGGGGKERERDWIGQSVRESRIEEGRTSRNNVLAHFLKSPPDPRRRGGGGGPGFCRKKNVTDAWRYRWVRAGAILRRNSAGRSPVGRRSTTECETVKAKKHSPPKRAIYYLQPFKHRTVRGEFHI